MSLRPARWLPLALLLSCAPSAGDGGAGLSMVMHVPLLTWQQLDDSLHLRIFPKGDHVCDESTGLITRGGAPVTDYPGNDVKPFDRCGDNWPTLRSMYGGEASPVDLCIAKDMSHGVDVPSGSYIILIEGSGYGADPTSGAQVHYTLARGCTTRDVTTGSSMSVAITLHEQGLFTGNHCGDGTVDANEQCDDGSANAAGAHCDEKCRFPERTVNTTTTGIRRNPAIAWAVSQPLVVGFEAQTDVWVHLFDAEGGGMPTATNDVALDPNTRNKQSNVALAATASGFAAGWASSARDVAAQDILGAITPDYGPRTPTTTVQVNPTTALAETTMRSTPAVAVSGNTTAWLFRNDATSTLRFSTTNTASPPTAPSMDAAVTGATGASEPRLAAVADGFVAVWSTNASGNSDVMAAHISTSGTVGTPVMVASDAGGNQNQPAIGVSGSDVVIAWQDDAHGGADTSGTTVRWRHFSASLAPMGADLLAPSTTDGNQSHPAVAVNGSGVALVAWLNEGDGTIRGRLFRLMDGQATPNRFSGSADDFELDAPADESGHTAGPRANPVAAFGGMNRFAVAWEDQSGGAGSSEIHMRVLLGQ